MSATQSYQGKIYRCEKIPNVPALCELNKNKSNTSNKLSSTFSIKGGTAL